MPDIQPVCNRKFLAVVAYPDDAEALCGGTITKAIQAVKLFEQLAVDGILQHSSRLASQALMSQPLVLSFTHLTKLVNEYLPARTAYIGEWRDHD